MNFEFRTVPYLINQPGSTAQLGILVAQHYPATKRVMIVTDKGFLATGQVHPIIIQLEQSGLEVVVYANVVADPPTATVLSAASQAKNARIDLVIGLGGGSSMDVAKLIAVLANSEQELSSMFGIGNVSGTRLPLIQIPTTAGTGSEVTPIAIVTTGSTTKMGVVAPQLYADMAILDAELTLGLPTAVTAATGIDAMVHAIEAYTTRHKKNPLSDMLAKEALALLWNNIELVCADGNNIHARQAMLLGSMLAGQAFANAPCAAVHALAYPIGGVFHVPHGLSNSLVLPHVLRFNLPNAANLYAELAAIIAPEATGSAEKRSNALIEAVAALTQRVGIPTRLRDVDIHEKDLDQLAADAMLQTRLLGNNPREVSLQDAREIYASAL